MAQEIKKDVLEVEVLISEKDLKSNPELLEIYDDKSNKLKFELDKNIPKNFKKKLIEIMPEFKAGDIVYFNPLLKAVNMLQDIKILIPDADEDFEVNNRTLIDNNKIIGSFNTSLKEAKKAIKEPHVNFNKIVDELFKVFDEESKNTRNALEKNFKEIVDEKERIKEEKEAKKKEKELAEIQKLQSENEEMQEKMKSDEFNRTCIELESTFDKIVTNTIEKIPSLNEDGLKTLKAAIASKKDTDYMDSKIALILKDKYQDYIDLFKSKRQLAISQVDSAINKIQLNQELEKRKLADEVSKNSTPAVPSNDLFENSGDIPEIPNVESFETIEEPKVKEPENDVERFQAIADFDNEMLENYKIGIERISSFKFDNNSLEKLKQQYVEKQYGNVLGFLEKLQNYSSNKSEEIKQKLS